MKLKSFAALSFSLAMSAGLATAEERLPTKQLAGPIDEIRNGVMAPVNPIDAAVSSKSAMIPVNLELTKNGDWRWNGTVSIDNDRFNMVLFAGGENWNVRIGQGAGAALKSLAPAHELALNVERANLGVGYEDFVGDHYRFEKVQPGEWTVSVSADAPLTGQGYLLYSSDSDYRLLSYQASNDQLVGDEISFVSYGFQKSAGIREKAHRGMVTESSLRVVTPAGEERFFEMFDDGLHGDGRAGDGVFGGSFAALEAGMHTAQVIVRGTTPEGAPFVRTAEHVVPVVAPKVELAMNVAESSLVDDRRLQVSLAVNNAVDAPEKYRVFAEVWGQDRNGQMQAINWIGGISYVEDGRLNLGLDLRWLGLSAARSNFELRNVRIEDPDTFVAVSRVDRMPLVTPRLPNLDRMMPKSIDQEMLMGPRPAKPVEKAGKLLLVHGYCSGDAWGPVSGQFSNWAKFQDFNQNRSHDTFAVLVGTFGAQYSSFGIVAHSQGGAASLHLYTYYWSGLDYASGNRLIQSVGTPYQGTALAGNAAVLGQIFGIGCGVNNDLTYSGASSWLSGIPSWARGEVTYYTTAFKDVWWRYDYCQIVTDVLLNDPDDGTTEKSKGQLSGANNGGHKSGWCHTNGMRDPNQVTDSSRNSNMNSNAAR